MHLGLTMKSSDGMQLDVDALNINDRTLWINKLRWALISWSCVPFTMINGGYIWDVNEGLGVSVHFGVHTDLEAVVR